MNLWPLKLGRTKHIYSVINKDLLPGKLIAFHYTCIKGSLVSYCLTGNYILILLNS
jgi:hypothetical protein